jgi:hypothetical protein
MSGEFAVEVGAIRAQAQNFMGVAGDIAQLVDEVRALDLPRTGDGRLDGVIARLLDEIRVATDGIGMVFEADGRGLMANAALYESSDAATARLAEAIDARTVS